MTQADEAPAQGSDVALTLPRRSRTGLLKCSSTIAPEKHISPTKTLNASTLLYPLQQSSNRVVEI